MARKTDERRQQAELYARYVQSSALFDQQYQEALKNDPYDDDDEDELGAEEEEERELTDEEIALQISEAAALLRRQDIAAPPPAPGAGTSQNPYSIVDIITFCEHDYYLGLRLTPWQQLILQTFYMGTEGNYHIGIGEERPEEGCEGCVWSKNLESELEHAKTRKYKGYKTKLRVEGPENSRCLLCTRFDPAVRTDRYAEMREVAPKEGKAAVQAERQIAEYEVRELQDNFQNQMDLIMGRRGGQEDDNFAINPKVRENLLSKMGLKFQELILVLGRRSGKSFMVSIIALYEAYKFLMMGHPQSKYPLKTWDEIMILNVALSEKQAKGAIFNKLREDVLASPFFASYIGKVTSTDMYLLTPADKEENKRREKTGTPKLVGSIHIKSGNSNSASQLGGTIAVIIIDEMAAMARPSADGTATDEMLYTLLKPSIATFGFDGKIICISNPLGPFGFFYKLFTKGLEDNLTLIHQLPTWLSNPSVPREYIESERKKDPVGFQMQYAAKFEASGENAWLPDECVNLAFPPEIDKDKPIRRREHGEPLFRYYMHLDPAYSNDRYTLCILHAEPIEGATNADGSPMTKVVIDHLHYWAPLSKGKPINVEEIEKYVLDVGRRFRVAKITYDQHWSSQSSIVKFTRAGFRCEMTPYVHQYQNLIYGELYDLFTSGRIDFYQLNTTFNNVDMEEINLAKKEFQSLQKIWKNGKPKIEAPNEGTDDFADCIAGAAYQAIKDKDFKSLARPRLGRIGMPNHIPGWGRTPYGNRW